MRELFKLDKEDYDNSWPVFSRPSVRGIIEKNGKLLMVRSQKYNYTKFPGGGIEQGETHLEALIREVREETGYEVIPESVKEYGYVLCRQADSYEKEKVFEQMNYYYICQVGEEQGETEYSGYEIDDGFMPEWIRLSKAEWLNRRSVEDFGGITAYRELKVISMYYREMRTLEREAHERETLKKIGDGDYAEMLDFVKNTLEGTKTEKSIRKKGVNYSRFDHIKRVLGWALRLYEASPYKDEIRYEDVMIATIFHDVGRAAGEELNIPHAEAGVPITRKYLEEHGYDSERIEYICGLVKNHSKKKKMHEEGTDRGFVLLCEADLLDDMGALGIIMDAMIVEGRSAEARFEDVYDHICEYTLRQQHDNPCVTPEGRKMWDKKTRLVEAFMDSLNEDILL